MDGHSRLYYSFEAYMLVDTTPISLKNMQLARC